MLHTPKDQATRHENSPSCTVWEYGNQGAMDGADALVNGRYPEKGFALNDVSDMSIRIIGGGGYIATKQAIIDVKAGDVAIIPHGEPYYFEGIDLRFFMACSPAWSLAQYKEIE